MAKRGGRGKASVMRARSCQGVKGMGGRENPAGDKKGPEGWRMLGGLGLGRRSGVTFATVPCRAVGGVSPSAAVTGP